MLETVRLKKQFTNKLKYTYHRYC